MFKWSKIVKIFNLCEPQRTRCIVNRPLPEYLGSVFKFRRKNQSNRLTRQFNQIYTSKCWTDFASSPVFVFISQDMEQLISHGACHRLFYLYFFSRRTQQVTIGWIPLPSISRIVSIHRYPHLNYWWIPDNTLAGSVNNAKSYSRTTVYRAGVYYTLGRGHSVVINVLHCEVMVVERYAYIIVSCTGDIGHVSLALLSVVTWYVYLMMGVRRKIKRAKKTRLKHPGKGVCLYLWSYWGVLSWRAKSISGTNASVRRSVSFSH